MIRRSHNITIKKRSINDEDLFQRLNNEIYSVVALLRDEWADEKTRYQFIETVEDYLEEIIETGEIVQAKVVCNKSNNPTFSQKAKEFVVEIHYRQPHCLNVSKIEYHIPNPHGRK